MNNKTILHFLEEDENGNNTPVASEELECGEEIQEACDDNGIVFGCTEGLCLSCQIEVVKGMENLSSPTEQEQDILGEDTITDENIRLACQCQIMQGEVFIKEVL